MTKKPQAYPPRYVEDFFGVSNEVASSAEALSEGGRQTIEMRNRKSFFTTLLGANSSGKEWWEKAGTPTPVAHQADYQSLLKARLLQVHLAGSSLETFSEIFNLVEELGGLQNAQRAIDSLEYLQNVGTSTTAVCKPRS